MWIYSHQQIRARRQPWKLQRVLGVVAYLERDRGYQVRRSFPRPKHRIMEQLHWKDSLPIQTSPPYDINIHRLSKLATFNRSKVISATLVHYEVLANQEIETQINRYLVVLRYSLHVLHQRKGQSNGSQAQRKMECKRQNRTRETTRETAW